MTYFGVEVDAIGMALLVNELLCYMLAKIDSVPTDTLTRLVNENFSDDEVEAAKALLCEYVADSIKAGNIFFPQIKFLFHHNTKHNTIKHKTSHNTSMTMDDNDFLRPVWPGRDGAITRGYSVPTPGRAVGYLPGREEL